MNRREFLKIMLGTVPALPFSSSLALLWPIDEHQRPGNDPVVIGIDNSGYLYDPNFEPDFITRRAYYNVDSLTGQSRLDFYIAHWGEDGLHDLLRYDKDETQKPSSLIDRLDELDEQLGFWLNDELDPEEGSFREQLDNSSYWIGGWLYDNLSSQTFQQAGLDYVEGEHPGSSFCAVRYRGEIEQLNSVLFRNGLNAVCIKDRGTGHDTAM